MCFVDLFVLSSESVEDDQGEVDWELGIHRRDTLDGARIMLKHIDYRRRLNLVRGEEYRIGCLECKGLAAVTDAAPANTSCSRRGCLQGLIVLPSADDSEAFGAASVVKRVQRRVRRGDAKKLPVAHGARGVEVAGVHEVVVPVDTTQEAGEKEREEELDFRRDGTLGGCIKPASKDGDSGDTYSGEERECLEARGGQVTR